jgi:HK97 family phage major capsid protein
MRAAAALEYIPITQVASPTVLNYVSLVDLVAQPKERYLLGDSVAFVMHRTTLAQVRKLLDSTGQPIWQPSVIAGTPSTLLGYSVFTTDAMPTFAADANIIAFGNWKAGYLLADRVGMRILQDPFTAIGQVSFYVRKRVGGTVLLNDSLKILRLSDS